MFKAALNEDYVLLQAIVAGFNSVPELMRNTTPELLDSEAKKLLALLQGANPKKAFDTAGTRAQELWKQLFTRIIQELQAEKKQIQLTLREQKKQREIEEAIESARIREVAIPELEAYILSKLQDKDLFRPQQEGLKYFKHRDIDGKRDPEVAYLFPGSSRDQRYQWLARIKRFIAADPSVSEDAKKFLRQRTRAKFATDKLLYAATVFYKRCLKG